jgi:undecaprenyl-diphosphatase
MSWFAIEYFFFALVSNLGLLTVIAGNSQLEFLKVIKHPKKSRYIGVLAIISAFAWYFGFENRNINDFEGGLDANTQALVFVIATFTSIILVLISNSILRTGKSEIDITMGLDVLKESTYVDSFLQQGKSIPCFMFLVINEAKQKVSKMKLSAGLVMAVSFAVGLQVAYSSSSKITDWTNLIGTLKLDSVVAYDLNLSLAINRYAGKWDMLDLIISIFASDYFFPVIFALFLVGIWFNGSEQKERVVNQHIVIFSIISLAFVNWIVFVINAYLFRPRPFENEQISLIFYEATDSSFPSNALAVLFAISITTLITNRRYGISLMILSIVYGISRIYVGVHYPLDILSALILGVIAAGIVCYIGKLIYPMPLAVIKLLRLVLLA